MWREAVVAYLKYCAVVCLETLRKTTIYTIWDSDSHGRDLKLEYSE